MNSETDTVNTDAPIQTESNTQEPVNLDPENDGLKSGGATTAEQHGDVLGI